MKRLPRYATGLLVASVVTAGIAFFEPPTGESLQLLLGIALVYGVGTVIALRYWPILRSKNGPKWVTGAFVGVMTFGCLSLLNGVAPSPNFGVAVLGYGLAGFGFVSGIAFEHGREPSS